jgi:hypothetical protein
VILPPETPAAERHPQLDSPAADPTDDAEPQPPAPRYPVTPSAPVSSATPAGSYDPLRPLLLMSDEEKIALFS